MTKPTLSAEEKDALEHRLAMYKQLSLAYPMEHRHLQKQIEVLILLHRLDEAELLLLQLRSNLSSRGMHDEADKTNDIRKHINSEKLCKQLYSTPFLHLASSNFLEKAFLTHRRIELKEGDYLIRYGDVENQMFIVVKGELAVWSRDEDRKKHFEHVMHAGEVIGELAFLDNTPRSADVIACKDSTVLAIPSKAALKLFLENPGIEDALRKSATSRRIQLDLKCNSHLNKLPKEVQSLLSTSGRYVTYQPLQRIYRFGQNIQSIDLIIAGYVRHVGELKDGSSVMLNSLKKGALLGCSAATPHMNKTYVADIVAIDEVTLIQFPLDYFKEIIKTNPRLSQAVLESAESEQGDLLQTITRSNT